VSRTIVFVSCADSGELRVLRLDATGTLVPLQTLAIGGQVMPLALSPDRRFLYAARRSEPLAVLGFAIDPASGELAPLGEAPLPASMAYLATDRSGRWLFSASYGGNLVAVSPLAANGAPGACTQTLPTPPNAHAIVVDPSNRFVFSTSLGGGVVMQWRFDAARGTLAPNTPASIAPHGGGSPRHLVFGRDARFVYLLNELDAAIDVLAFDAAAGTLRAVQTIDSLPPGLTGEPWAADLRLAPDGHHLYSSERRSSTLAAFRVDAASGELTRVLTVPTETQPRGFAISPDGRFLVAAGQASHALSVHEIDAATGALSWRSRCAVGRNPNWVEIIETAL
jgi:6-phosphogluconolactonase